MTKKYTKDMTVEEVIERLQKGEVIKDEDDSGLEIKMINGIIVLKNDGDLIVGAKIITVIDGYYFEDTEPFQITETGLYKTRDGRKAFVSTVEDDESVFKTSGIVEGCSNAYTWLKDGFVNPVGQSTDDLVSKWEE